MHAPVRRLWSAPTELRTDRLSLRAIGTDDAEAFASAVRDNREHLAPWVPLPPDASVRWMEIRVAEIAEAFARGSRLLYGIRLHGCEELIGCVGLRFAAPDDDSCSISYWLDTRGRRPVLPQSPHEEGNERGLQGEPEARRRRVGGHRRDLMCRTTARRLQ